MPDHNRDFRDEPEYNEREPRAPHEHAQQDPYEEEMRARAMRDEEINRAPREHAYDDSPSIVDPRDREMYERDMRERDMRANEMRDRHPEGMNHPEHRANKLSDLKGKSILNTRTGERLGQVDDIMVDPHTLAIAGLVLSTGGMFNKESKIVPASDVETWGRDAILIHGDQLFLDGAEIPEWDSWISTNDRLNGLSVVTTTGEKIGQMDEVLVDHRGQIVAYRITEGMGGFGADSYEIPAQATRTLGKDVAIVDYAPRRHKGDEK